MFFKFKHEETLKEKHPDLWNFLAGNFHEDVDTIDEAVLEYLELASKANIKKNIKRIETFLKDKSFSVEKKNEFINDLLRQDISYLPSPLNALEQISMKMSIRLVDVMNLIGKKNK